MMPINFVEGHRQQAALVGSIYGFAADPAVTATPIAGDAIADEHPARHRIRPEIVSRRC